MSSLQEQLFVQVASKSLNHLAKDLQKKYEPKKGDRFNVGGITYEIGPPKFVNQGIQFEISSKIPGEELPSSYDHAQFFQEIEALCRKSEKKPEAADMENIVRETRDQERKERDYVKLTYRYAGAELYDEKRVASEAENLAKNPGGEAPPLVPGVTTLAARLVLREVERHIYDNAMKNIETLIRANDEVRGSLKKAKKK